MNVLIKLAEVKSRTALSKSSIYKLMNKGLFPKSVVIGDRAVAWIDVEIQEWIENKVSARRDA